MKRVIAVSDSHGYVNDLRDAIELAEKVGQIDVLVFLGDGYADIEVVWNELKARSPQTAIYIVRGNNDWRYQSPNHVAFKVDGVTFYACHGHEWQVKYSLHRLCSAAKEKDARVALYGHTHRSHLEMDYGLYLMNPGAICERGIGKSAYAEIYVSDEGQINADLVFWK